jgi:hypothetical protein
MMSNLADQLAQMRSSSHEVRATGLTEQLEQMRIRMNDAARRESDLAAELNAAIRRMDDQLLHEVRSMAAEHEARRAHLRCRSIARRSSRRNGSKPSRKC